MKSVSLRLFVCMSMLLMVFFSIPLVSASELNYTDDGFEYVIYENEVSIIGYVGDAANITIPSEVEGYPVTEISGAFNCCETIENVVIPEGVTHITFGAFQGCSSLKSVTIPVSLKFIANSVFWNCESLTDVYYDGTKDQWAQVEVQNGNDDFLESEFHLKDNSDSNSPKFGNIIIVLLIAAGVLCVILVLVATITKIRKP